MFKGEIVDDAEPIISDDDNIDDVIDEICNGEITEEEIAMSIRALKSDKSPGQDEIPPLLLNTQMIFLCRFLYVFLIVYLTVESFL